MSEAPEKIWARFRLTRVFAGSERVAGGTEYVRADLAEALRSENERLLNRVSEALGRISWYGDDDTRLTNEQMTDRLIERVAAARAAEAREAKAVEDMRERAAKEAEIIDRLIRTYDWKHDYPESACREYDWLAEEAKALRALPTEVQNDA